MCSAGAVTLSRQNIANCSRMFKQRDRGNRNQTETDSFYWLEATQLVRWPRPRAMSKDFPVVRQSACNGLSTVLDRLQTCGWYWGAMDSVEAMRRLKSTPCGTYLLRDSSDSRHLFTLSVRTVNGMTSVRLLFKRGRFALDSVEPECEKIPNFDCVLKLIYYYVRVSNNADGRQVFAKMENDEAEETPLVLKKPLYQDVPCLKHLCRRVINGTRSREEVMQMNLPCAIENYLIKYPYPI